jgi:hypothetical protein
LRSRQRDRGQDARAVVGEAAAATPRPLLSGELQLRVGPKRELGGAAGGGLGPALGGAQRWIVFKGETLGLGERQRWGNGRGSAGDDGQPKAAERK